MSREKLVYLYQIFVSSTNTDNLSDKDMAKSLLDKHEELSSTGTKLFDSKTISELSEISNN